MNPLDAQIELQQSLEQGHPSRVYSPVFGRGAQESAAGFLGRITPYAPDGGADWTDARYWVREVLAETTSATICNNRFIPTDTRRENSNAMGRYWVTATNISEYIELVSGGQETHAFGVSRDTPHTDWPLVRVWAVEHRSCGFLYYFDKSLGGGMGNIFTLQLSQTGGSQGTSTTPASWTYNVREAANRPWLAENVNPVVSPHRWKRPSVGWMSAATFGYAHFNPGSSAPVLGWINEMVGQEACS